MTEDAKKKPEDVTKAGAVELDESKLDQVSGGYITMEHPDVRGKDDISYSDNDSKGKKKGNFSFKSTTKGIK